MFIYIYIYIYVRVKVCNSVYVCTYILHDYTFSTLQIVSIPTTSFNSTKEMNSKVYQVSNFNLLQTYSCVFGKFIKYI